MEDGEIDEVDAAFIAIAALPGPNIPSAGKSLVKNTAGELSQDAVQRKLYDLVPIAEENVARNLKDNAVKELMDLSKRARHSKIGNLMHDEMGYLAEQHGLAKYTIRGIEGPDFKCDGFWFDLSTKNTWHGKIDKYKAKHGINGKPIYYDPAEVLIIYQKLPKP